MHGKSCRDSGQTHGEQEDAGACLPKQVWKMIVLKTQASSLPMILGASFLMLKGVQLALHRAPPGVHGRKEARGWVAGGRKKRKGRWVSNSSGLTAIRKKKFKKERL